METHRPCSTGIATLAAKNASTTTSIPSAKSFWRTQERQGRW